MDGQNNLHEITTKMLEYWWDYHNAKKEIVHKSKPREMEVRRSVTNLLLDVHVDLGQNNAEYSSTNNNERDPKNLNKITAEMIEHQRGYHDTKKKIVDKRAAKEIEVR